MHNRDNRSMLHRVEECQILRLDVEVTEARTINESIQKHLGAGGDLGEQRIKTRATVGVVRACGRIYGLRRSGLHRSADKTRPGNLDRVRWETADGGCLL